MAEIRPTSWYGKYPSKFMTGLINIPLITTWWFFTNPLEKFPQVKLDRMKPQDLMIIGPRIVGHQSLKFTWTKGGPFPTGRQLETFEETY